MRQVFGKSYFMKKIFKLISKYNIDSIISKGNEIEIKFNGETWVYNSIDPFQNLECFLKGLKQRLRNE